MKLKSAFRRLRTLLRQMVGREPLIVRNLHLALEFHGTEYGGWPIVQDSLSEKSLIVDIGLGEDISFSESLIQKYRCRVCGFDPTPRSIDFVRKRQVSKFTLFEFGVGAKTTKATLYLPNAAGHVSGSLIRASHVGSQSITVSLVAIGDVPRMVGTDQIDLLKMDVEGAEYDIIESNEFAGVMSKANQICIEVHHRWPEFGKEKTSSAVKRLRNLGFVVAWVSDTNEEILFVRASAYVERV